MRSIAILLASGTGSRLNSSIPKQFIKVKGKYIFQYCLDTFIKSNLFDYIVLVTNKKYIDLVKKEVLNYKQVLVTVGGDTRLQSFLNSIEFLNNKIQLKDDDFIVTHDVARTNVSIELLNKHFDRFKKGFKVINTIINSYDTMTLIKDNKIYSYPSREHCFNVQTPQSFEYKQFKNLKCNIQTDVTDLIKLFYLGGLEIDNVIGEPTNFKITTNLDLDFFKYLKDDKKI